MIANIIKQLPVTLICIYRYTYRYSLSHKGLHKSIFWQLHQYTSKLKPMPVVVWCWHIHTWPLAYGPIFS